MSPKDMEASVFVALLYFFALSFFACLRFHILLLSRFILLLKRFILLLICFILSLSYVILLLFLVLNLVQMVYHSYEWKSLNNILEVSQMPLSLPIALSIILFLFLCYSYHKDRTKLANGNWFWLFIISLLVSVVAYVSQSKTQLAQLLAMVISTLTLFFLVFGLVFLIGLLLLNFKIVHKREKLTLTTLMTFILAIGLALTIAITWANISNFLPISLLYRQLLWFLPISVLYFMSGFISFLISNYLFQKFNWRYKPKAIIVLGCGLINGTELSTLLKSRLDLGLKWFNKTNKRKSKVTVVCSGGQGPDEDISEGQAMARYLSKNGVPETQLIIEDQSKNTYENLLFTKRKLLALIKESRLEENATIDHKTFPILLVTNNFHVLRAAILAKKLGLTVRGVGSKVAPYYLPNALLREYFGIISSNYKRYITTLAILLLLFLILLVILNSYFPELIIQLT
ncbi:MAG TPA: YdcF family protein [Bavariicoccus seileri]|uniref:YdcF family protein n=2 Tax=Bavariicoccus seileri TaxID=549685 RepID=A0A3D4S4S6_9ENTE|nr:YdcF family protein [Bavariicoccus seileri]